MRINSGGMQVGSLIAFMQYAMQIMFSFLMVSMLFVMVPRAAAAATRINEVLDTMPDIVDPPQPRVTGADVDRRPWMHMVISPCDAALNGLCVNRRRSSSGM